jgi:hypothetical protein
MSGTPFDNDDLFIDYGAIFEKCFELYGVIDICLKISTSKACVKVKLAGIEVDEKCVSWDKNGPNLSAKIDLGTVRAGIWKLTGAEIGVVHNLDTNDGSANFKASFYKLTGVPPEFRKQRDIDEQLASW